MSNIIDFYKQVIENVGLAVDDEGYIYNSDEDDKVMITNDGKPMVLPTREHIKNIYTQNEDGEMVISKSLFNPLNEDVVKGDSPSFKKLKIFIERRLGHVFYLVGKGLLILADNKNLQRKTSLEINKWLASFSEANGKGVKSVVDGKTLEAWDKIYSNSLKKTGGMFNIIVKKQGKYESEVYNRLAVLGSDVYDELVELDKEGTVYDVKIRNKDIVVFKNLFEYLLPDLDDNGTVNVGSNDDICPAFITLMTMYVKLRVKWNKVVNHIKDVDKTLESSCHVDNLITIRELEDLDMYTSDLKTIPNEIDLNRGMVSQQQASLKDPGIPANLLNTNTVSKPISNVNRFPTTPVPVQQPEMDDDPVRRALGGRIQPQQQQGFIGVNSAINMQPPMNQYGISAMNPYQQQPTLGMSPYMSQPPQQQFVGVNNIGMQQGGYNISNPSAYYGSSMYPYGR